MRELNSEYDKEISLHTMNVFATKYTEKNVEYLFEKLRK